MRSFAGALTLLATLSCAGGGAATKPLRTVELARGGEGRCLVVLLPGRWSEPERFARAGFAAAVAERRLPLDLVAVEAPLSLYRDRSIVTRLHADVVAPARAKGYTSIWLAGTSIGGLGALLYLRDRPGEIDGAFAMAPFLGEADLIAEIAAAGGPTRWQPPARIAADDIGRELWSWLATWSSVSPPVPVELGWGSDDAFAPANRLFAALLPKERIDTVPGGHDWKTWERLWERFLDRGLPSGVPCGVPRTSG